MVLGLVLFSRSEAAIPGPIPKPPIEISQTEPIQSETTETRPDQTEPARTEPDPVSFSETVHLFRTENMKQILSGFHTGLKSTENSSLVDFISDESRRYGFEPELILALISTESSFYNWSVSKVGALGLMQIVPTTGKALAKVTQIAWHDGNESLFDPYVNIRLGIHYLHSLNEQFKDIRVALAAYNFGPTKVRRWVRRGRPIPTRYANKVMRSYKAYLSSDIHYRNPSDLSSKQAAHAIPKRNDI